MTPEEDDPKKMTLYEMTSKKTTLEEDDPMTSKKITLKEMTPHDLKEDNPRR